MSGRAWAIEFQLDPIGEGELVEDHAGIEVSAPSLSAGEAAPGPDEASWLRACITAAGVLARLAMLLGPAMAATGDAHRCGGGLVVMSLSGGPAGRWLTEHAQRIGEAPDGIRGAFRGYLNPGGCGLVGFGMTVIGEHGEPPFLAVSVPVKWADWWSGEIRRSLAEVIGG